MTYEQVPYDAVIYWFYDAHCNLRCKYCFGLNTEEWKKRKQSWSEDSLKEGNGRKGGFVRSGDPQPIDTERFLSVLERTGKIFKIVFSGSHAEPFTIPNFIEACKKISERHYIGMNTNLTLPVVCDFVKEISPERVRSIVASAHLDEMERLGLTGQYIQNFLFLKERGFNISCLAVAYPSLTVKAESAQMFFKRNGIDLSFFPFYGTYEGREYPKAYNKKELDAFSFRKQDLKGQNFYGKYCNAGYNSVLALPDGNVIRCTVVDQHLGNVYEEIRFTQKLTECPVKFCACPVMEYEHELFMKALQNEDKDRESQ